MYQIFSRIEAADQSSFEVNTFQSTLKNLVTRICIDHPYHGIIQLIALANGNNVGSTYMADSYSENVGAAKSEESKQLLLRVQKDSEFLLELVNSYTTLTNAMIDVAMAPTQELVSMRTTKRVSLSKLLYSSKVTLDNCMKRCEYKPCVLTKSPSIRVDGDYGDGKEDPIGSELVHSYDRIFSLTDGGIHRPKIVECITLKGSHYTQLLKGEGKLNSILFFYKQFRNNYLYLNDLIFVLDFKDDIRQDAVLQQVFSTVNLLLNRNNHASVNKNLKLITYSCVPLSPAAGVLEWVDNTIPLRDYLVYAHNQYYPGEWDTSLCQNHFVHSPKDAKRETLEEIYRHFR